MVVVTLPMAEIILVIYAKIIAIHDSLSASTVVFRTPPNLTEFDSFRALDQLTKDHSIKLDIQI